MLLRVVRDGPCRVLAVTSDGGACPLLEFLDGLTGKLAGDGVRMLSRLTYVAQNGVPRNAMWCHQIQKQIWQLRQGDLRILYFTDGPSVVICSHGFVKKGQSTPAPEINRAQERAERYKKDKFARKLQVEDV